MTTTINNIIKQLNQYNEQKNEEIKNLQIQYDKLNNKYQKLVATTPVLSEYRKQYDEIKLKYEDLERAYKLAQQKCNNNDNLAKDIITEIIQILNNNDLLTSIASQKKVNNSQKKDNDKKESSKSSSDFKYIFDQFFSPNQNDKFNISNENLLNDYTKLAKDYDNLTHEFNRLQTEYKEELHINQDILTKLKYFEKENKQLELTITELRHIMANGYFINYNLFVKIINSLYANDLRQLADELATIAETQIDSLNK